jgi:hypothetical protein
VSAIGALAIGAIAVRRMVIRSLAIDTERLRELLVEAVHAKVRTDGAARRRRPRWTI